MNFDINSIKSIRSLENDDLAAYICNQINHFFPDNKPISKVEISSAIKIAEERIFYCLHNIHKKYFNEGEATYFNHLISDQYCMYLYMLANYYYRETKEELLATKLYYLNKALHAVDIFYTSHLPDIFLLVHPIGTIIGRATFSDYFIAYQGCTVGCLNEGIFPTFKGKTIMYANSSVLGASVIGDNVCIAANASVSNRNVESNSILMGTSPNILVRPNTKNIFERPPFVYGK